MLNKEDILALAWEHSEGSGKRYIFTEENLFEFLKELKKETAPAQDERDAFEARMVLEAGPRADDLWIKGNPSAGYSNERVNDHRFGWVACLEWMANRPAQKVNNVNTPEQYILLPERKPDFPSPDATGEDWENSGWNAALDELARLNSHLLAD